MTKSERRVQVTERTADGRLILVSKTLEYTIDFERLMWLLARRANINSTGATTLFAGIIKARIK